MTPKKRYERIYTKPDGAPCNICEHRKELTEDHVPPKSCLEHLSVQLEPFEHRLRADPPRLPLSQNGVKFRTLCGDCNSRLGQLVVPTWVGPPLCILSDGVNLHLGPGMRLIMCHDEGEDRVDGTFDELTASGMTFPLRITVSKLNIKVRDGVSVFAQYVPDEQTKRLDDA